MKNQMKNLSKTLLASAALTLAAGSAFADLTANGAMATATCALGFSATSAGNATANLTITVPTVSTAQVNALAAAGPIKDTFHKTTFFVKPISTSCISSGGAGTFNVYFTSSSNTAKAANTATTTPASNLTIDLVPTSPTSIATADSGMDLTKLTAATQHGMTNALISSGNFSVDARYWKTSALTTTGSNVTSVFVANSEYQ